MGRTPVKPSEIRNRILRQHIALRARLDELGRAAARLTDGSGSLREVAGLCLVLHGEICDHLEIEDEVLAPALRQIDSWGPVRAESLLGHHQMQRKDLSVLLHASAIEIPELASTIGRLIGELRDDMAHEDHDILTSDLLRDDVLAIDLEAG
jgi:hypothetical protein